MKQYLIDPLTKDIFNIKGRSSRKAFWMFTLLSLPVFTLLGGLSMGLLSIISPTLGMIAYVLIIFYYILAEITLAVRRYHDVNHSFWWSLVPFYNIYLMFLSWFVRGTEGPNKFGEDPTNLPNGTSTPGETVVANPTPTPTTPQTPTQTPPTTM